MYVDNWIAQIQGKPVQQQQPAQPIPSTEGSDNLAFGIPGPADCIVDREGYALGYIEYHELPAWVIYHMTKEEATTKAASREDNFRPDPEIPTGSATLADYRGSGYDRGDLAPAADMSFSNFMFDREEGHLYRFLSLDDGADYTYDYGEEWLTEPLTAVSTKRA